MGFKYDLQGSELGFCDFSFLLTMIITTFGNNSGGLDSTQGLDPFQRSVSPSPFLFLVAYSDSSSFWGILPKIIFVQYLFIRHFNEDLFCVRVTEILHRRSRNT